MSWTTENYFAKAQMYWQKATSCGRDNEDFLLNVSFTVEFVARGALCYVNPALNSGPDIESLFYACGQTPRNPPKTADFAEVMRRLQRLVPTLTDAELANVRTIMDARNGELHGDKAEIAQLKAQTLMAPIYSFLVKVAKFSAQNLQALLGVEDGRLAEQTAEAMTKDRSKRVQSLIQICKERFFSLSEEQQMKNRNAAKTDAISAILTTGHHVMYLKCPSCAQNGQLLAAPVGRSAPFLRGDSLVQEVRVIPMQFVCKCCGLEIRGLDELMAAGFTHEYCSIDDVDPVDHFNIDPHDYIDPDAIAREYHRDMYDYQDE